MSFVKAVLSTDDGMSKICPLKSPLLWASYSFPPLCLLKRENLPRIRIRSKFWKKHFDGIKKCLACLVYDHV